MTTSQSETDYRLSILDSLLQSTHRDLNSAHPFHKDIIAKDPIFYNHLAAWYCKKGDVRDSKILFISNLCMSQHHEDRNIGLALLRELPPFQVVQVVDFIRSINKHVPMSVKTEVTRYLRDREANPSWFDDAVIVARKDMKDLYIKLRIKPSERAQAILFDEEPPVDSKPYALKQIAKSDNLTEQAELILKHKIPYRIAVGVIKTMTPAVIGVLVNNMSTQELIGCMASLQKRGALDNPEIKSIVETKLEAGKTAKNTTALKGLKAVQSGGLSADINAKLNEIVDTQVKNKGRIKRPTAILVDKSASMEAAIQLAKQVGVLVSSIMDAELFCYAFDVISYPIQAKGREYKDWDSAFRGINAHGGTVPSAAINALMRNNQRVEQIILITDEGENHYQNYRQSLDAYCAQMNVKPYTYIVRCSSPQYGASDRIYQSLISHNYQADAYNVDLKQTDYYSIVNIIPYLTKGSRTELLEEIMSYHLPERKCPQLAHC